MIVHRSKKNTRLSNKNGWSAGVLYLQQHESNQFIDVWEISSNWGLIIIINLDFRLLVGRNNHKKKKKKKAFSSPASVFLF